MMMSLEEKQVVLMKMSPEERQVMNLRCCFPQEHCLTTQEVRSCCYLHYYCCFRCLKNCFAHCCFHCLMHPTYLSGSDC
ncbi:hypothetical protein NBRC111894_1605 [Sporolactobacillus inulinus]|uniref:Uncharacterized protein n=1 Tax=Sporolactobacillus inulinus TaxID=2078 RepID=A0A4Y1ZAU5_9BACL|nr:hypothetical protein NBRC111894_1605 [Sporolactobacillus inulinus]